ncbi:MAG TPA: MerR family transcriptional regulator [Yinghuangia sp.]|nr:MerR family transcriptional regulator [Yinghuangia sp.]
MSAPGQPSSHLALGLTVGAAARRLGVAVTTLRSWDRRYGLGASYVSVGGHRRYSPDDMRRLQRLCTLVADGAPVAEAARAVLEDTGAHALVDDDHAHGERPDHDESRTRTGPERPDAETPLSDTHARRLARGLSRAAMRLDSDAVNDALDRAVTEFGVPTAWEELIQPVLYGMGRKWESQLNGPGSNKYVEVEHLLSECVLSALHRAVGRSRNSVAGADGPLGARGVLLACTAAELHTLPLHALTAALAELGVPTRMFGASLPFDALLRAVDRTRPAAVVLWSQHPETEDPAALEELGGSSATTVLAGGPGWSIPLPHGTVRLTCLTQALAVLTPAD